MTEQTAAERLAAVTAQLAAQTARIEELARSWAALGLVVAAAEIRGALAGTDETDKER